MTNVIELSDKRDSLLYYIRIGLELHEIISIGSNDVDALADKVQAVFPKAKLTKADGYLMVENED